MNNHIQTAISEQGIEAYLHAQQHKSLLRFLTCGSVDDGKSTLIGRLLHDSQQIYEDQLKALESDSQKLGTTGEQATKRMIPDAKYISYETEQEGVIELVNGKIDAFIYDQPYNIVAVSQKGQGKIVHLDTPFTFEPIAWGIRKGDADFLNWLENFMFQVKNDGTYERLYHKWFQDDAWIKEIQ